MTIWIIVFTQLLFTSGDLLARSQVGKHGFHLATFISWWFVVYIVLRTAATFGQLYVLSTVKVGQTMALFAAASIVLVNVLGWFLLRETLSVTTYIGVSLAVVAFIVLALR